MEGLIKGLVHVAIDAVEDAVRERGHGLGGDDDGEAPRRAAPQRADPDADGEEERDERSRSTWAEVRATRCLHLRMRMLILLALAALSPEWFGCPAGRLRAEGQRSGRAPGPSEFGAGEWPLLCWWASDDSIGLTMELFTLIFFPGIKDKRHERREDEGWKRVDGRNQPQHPAGRQNQVGRMSLD
jgi:hypothetical protein